MLRDYKKYELFGKRVLQKNSLTALFEYDFPLAEQVYFLYVLEGELQQQLKDEVLNIPSNYSLFLNCIRSGEFSKKLGLG
jgi:hypothetical protein